MKLLLITVFFHPHKGGSELYALELFQHLMHNHSEIHADVICYNTNNSTHKEIVDGIQVHRIACFNIFNQQFYLPNPLSLIKSLWQLRSNHYEYVITQVRFFDVAWWSWLYARLIGAKSIFIEHGTNYVTHKNRLVSIVSKFIDNTIARFSLRKYDKVVVISKATLDFVKLRLKVNDPILIYGGINTNLFNKLPTKARLIPIINREVATNFKVITYIGRIIDAKGIWILFETIKKFSYRNDIVFCIGGSGYEIGNLRFKIETNNLGHKVFVLGELSYPDEVLNLLNITNIFINPSFNEGLPRLVMEACAMGNYVIATDVGSTKEIIIDKETGILIKPNDVNSLNNALEYALSNAGEYESICQNAIKHINNKFSWNLNIEHYYNLFKA